MVYFQEVAVKGHASYQGFIQNNKIACFAIGTTTFSLQFSFSPPLTKKILEVKGVR